MKQSTLSIYDFYKEICGQLKIDIHHSKRINLKNIQHEIQRLYYEKRITPIFIIDEANYLSSQIINDLKMLFNFDMDSKEPYVLILIGQQELRNTLNLRSNEAFKQRISTQYSFEWLDEDQSINYILDKLRLRGCNNKLIIDDALKQIARVSNGIPRLINRIVNKSLLVLENMKADIVNVDIVESAKNEIDI